MSDAHMTTQHTGFLVTATTTGHDNPPGRADLDQPLDAQRTASASVPPTEGGLPVKPPRRFGQRTSPRTRHLLRTSRIANQSVLNALRAGASRHGAMSARVRQVAARAGQHRLAMRMARRLAYLHGIPWFETALAPWLTTALAHDNGEALVAWVREMLASRRQVATTSESDEFAILSRQLHRVLASIEEARTW